MTKYVSLSIVVLFAALLRTNSQPPATDLSDGYVKSVQPLLKKYCYECHSQKVQKGDLDLERFTSLGVIRTDLKPWQHLIEQVEVDEMPPRGKPRPNADERKAILGWARNLLDTEARAKVGDPGRVPLRRLSNSEYDCTIRDLTGVDMKPTREFPADGAAGEGFTNAAESLSDITPTLFTRYLSAAKDIADRVVLLPDGFRFSSSKTRRDWTDESLAVMRKFYSAYTVDGRLVIQPYIATTIRHRDALAAGKIVEVAAQEKLNAKYLGIFWKALSDKAPSFPLDVIRARWQTATEKDALALSTEINEWQAALWRFEPVGSYRFGNMTRQAPNDPVASDVQPLKVAVKPAPGQAEVTLYLSTRELAGKPGQVVWQRPRFEAPGRTPLLLKDYPQFGVTYEVNRAVLFADTAKYLAAAANLAHDSRATVTDAAGPHNLDVRFLQRWFEVLDLKKGKPAPIVNDVPATPLELLDEKTPPNVKFPAVKGWRRKGIDLPVVVSNASNATLQVPGKIPPHKVAVHPTPSEFVAVAWKSPVAGNVQVAARIVHAHPSCGNSIAWRLEHRRAARVQILGEASLPLGGEGQASKDVVVEKGDLIILAIEPKDNNHQCDMTEINLTVLEGAKGRVWDLAKDIADTIQEANPHADQHGNKDTWSFVRGRAQATPKGPVTPPLLAPGSILADWRAAVLDDAGAAEGRLFAATLLADHVQKLLTGERPVKDKEANRVVYDALTAADGVLLKGFDLSKLTRGRAKSVQLGLAGERFTKDDLIQPADSVLEIRLPAALLREREFVVEGKLDAPNPDRLVLFHAATAPGAVRWNGKSPVVGAAKAMEKLRAGFDDFRRVFPFFLCFPNVVPTDEVVSLKMFHREDEPLERLFLDGAAKARIDHLWREHLYISRQMVAENDYLPQFIGFVTQDQPKKMLDYFMTLRPVFQKRAEEFEKEARGYEPVQMTKLFDFASRAFRRPLQDKEKTDLQELYDKLRKKDVPHDEAFRGVLTRVLIAPAFLFRIEKAPPGMQPGPIDDWELATRLSYFLWSSLPDDDLRTLAAAGKLRDPKVLADQTRRMLKDTRLRSLAIEFGTQWIHVREFDTLKEKNEKLFPTFDANLRKAIYEESILFFLDLFQGDRAVSDILDADHTFLNELLAKHYGISGVKGPDFRRVEGVRKFGRGGILGLASVHAKQSGASRTSPVLRGNWVVETLLGEKLPRPPANVPVLADEEGNDKLTTRQQVEKHVSVASCAACHVRIDPYGFAFENFDPIGRWRTKEISGLPVDTKAKLRDGTEFTGIDGLRTHLMTKKKDVIVRLFCQKLAGYALGRATTLSDTALIDEMVAELNRNDGRLSAAVLTIVRSPQFLRIRGSEVAAEE